MTDNEVWVQLYIGEVKSGQAFDVDHVPTNISALKKAVKKERSNGLGHCDAADLAVYKAGTDVPPKEEAPLRPDKPVPPGSTYDEPLRVVAPEKQPGKI
jgi:hypothetical protein